MGCKKLKGKERAELKILEGKVARQERLCKEEADRLADLRRRLNQFGS